MAGMISFWIRKAGGGTELERREEPPPSLHGDEMLGRVKASSLNRGDLMARIRRHSADEPRPAGADGAGEVVDPGRSGFQPGDRVMFLSHGCFAEYAAVEPGLAVRIPDSMSFEQAAAVPAAFLTAWDGLVAHGKAKPGDWVLVCGASSGVGVAALQIARQIGARVIATSGSARKLAALSAFGADVLVQARASAFVEEALRATSGRGVDVALNMVGGTAFPGCIQAAANFGRVVQVGYVDGLLRAECDLEAVHGRRLVISGTSNSVLSPAQRSANFQGMLRDVLPALASGAITSVIDRIFAFDELPAAKAYLETDQALGKVVVRME